jgi:thiol-disulfide isomerase/thioredoxin
MVAKRTTKMGKLTPYVDVRSPKDIPKFESMIKTGPVFVLVYADWCGHCKTFKQKMWDDVANSPNKSVNTAAVHYNMVEQTSMRNTPIEGYPTLFEVKPTPKANVTKPVQTPQTKEELETLVGVNNENENVSSAMKTNNKDPSMNTMDPNLIRSQRITQNSLNANKNSFEPDMAENLPPEPELESEPEAAASAPLRGGGVKSGGSLMETLLKLSADSAHAIILAGSAAELSRRWKKRHQTKRRRSGKSKQTRRR